NPARAIGIYSRCGSLESGKWANVVLLNRDLSIRNVIFKGEVVK
ncbi:amidohydrolase family protein, partial [Pseudoflavonifractor sp. CLA-AP-H29]